MPPEYRGSTPAEIEGHQLYTGTCHCGQVGVALMSKPLDETFDELMVECNCSVCERVRCLVLSCLVLSCLALLRLLLPLRISTKPSLT